MNEEITTPMVIYCNDTSAINISKNLIIHTKDKHVAMKYHDLRELVQDKQVGMEYVNMKEQLADIFTKALSKDAHEYLRGKIRVIPLYQAT